MSAPSSVQTLPARRMWRALEPYHAVTYFASESRAATDELGCRGGWMGYFGLRAAPLGEVPAEVVIATFYSFHPDRVRRAIPAAWRAASPADLLAARQRSVDAALRRMLGTAVDSPGVAEAAELAKQAALVAPVAGRPLAAAHSALRWPTEPHLVLWHAQTLLRESRGDGHVAALVGAGLDPCEALVAFAADGRADAEALRGHRGWSREEWSEAAARLVERGLMNPEGLLTEAGVATRALVEDRTDELAAVSWNLLGDRRCARLVELVAPLTRAIVANGGLAPDNPMGLRPLE